MRRLTSALLALILVLSLSIPAFAAETDENTATADMTTEYKASIDVKGEYVSDLKSKEIISVDVAWESMNFTYYGSREGTWNPTTHTYDGPKTPAWNRTKSNITVTNHSNLDVVANLKYTPTVETVTGSLDYQTLNLASAAEGDSLGNVNKAPTASSAFTIGGSMDKTSATGLGTITVSIESGWVTASTIEELIAALEKGGNIKLGEDITYDDILSTSANFNLDMNGKTLTIKQLKITGTSVASIYNGTLNTTAKGVVDAYCKKLTIDNCTLTGNGYYSLYLNSGVEAVVRNSTLNDGVCVDGGSTLMATENVRVNAGTTSIVVTGSNSKMIYCFNPSGYINASCDIIDNGDGTWTIKTS